MVRSLRRALPVLAILVLPAGADVVVPANGSLATLGGALALACTDLVVQGTVELEAGSITQVRDVVVMPGGVLVGGTGSLTLSRNFVVQPGGQFLAQGATVAYDTECGPGRTTAVPVPAPHGALLAWLAAALALLGAAQARRAQRIADAWNPR